MALGAAAAIWIAMGSTGFAAPTFTGPVPTDDAPLADPVVSADATFSANRAASWKQGDIQLLLLEGDVVFRLGTYGFRGERVVVRVDTQLRYRRQIQHLAVYFDHARPLHGAGPVQAEGPGLLVTASTRGKLWMDVPLLNRVEVAPEDAFVEAAAQRIAEHRKNLTDASQADQAAPDEPLFTPEIARLRQDRRRKIAEQQLESQVARLPRRTDQPPGSGTGADRELPGGDETVLPTAGVVQFTADRLWADAQRNTVALIGDVRVSYTDYDSDRVMTLTAERVVIFAQGDDVQDSLGKRQLEATQVTGVYLEDNVIVTDGQYTVRAPRMYFDLKRNKAILLEAVMYSWDVRHEVPLYIRADVIRQHSRTSFEANEALLTTSEFARPHVAIAAERLTIEQFTADGEGEQPRQRFTATNTSLQFNGVAVAGWPYLSGENNNMPLRRADARYSARNGPKIETTWDLFALSGREAPKNVDADLLLDYQGRHGPGVGVMMDYTRDNFFGELQTYLLPSDNGEDRIGDRLDVDHDNDIRGFARWQHRQYLANQWELSIEAAYVSDETFLEQFFNRQATETKTYETSIYLEKRTDESVFSLLTQYDLNSFTPQLATLQSPGYTVDKFPELSYNRTGTSLFGNRLTWFSETRISRMRLRVGKDSPLDRGFTAAISPVIFGIPNTTDFDAATGLPSSWVARFDTRQELTLPLQAGPVNITPYVVGRITAYDDDFAAFSPTQDDQIRFLGIVGTRFSTEFHRTLSDVESKTFDLHRLRHIVRPSINIWGGGSTIDPDDLPVYDTDVEAITASPGVRFGLRNTLQTQRGGPGRWRNVDWIVLDTDLVLRSDDSAVATELARYFDDRPELGTGGDHFYTRLLWMVTDTLAMTGELTENLEANHTAQWRLGATMHHTPRLSSFIDYAELDLIGSRLFTYGFNYQLTTKYHVGFSQRLDLADSGTDQINFMLERKMPRWRWQLVASIDDIDDETTVGVVLIPEGFGSSNRWARVIDPGQRR